MEPVMRNTARTLFVVGLRNAHAMERQSEQLIQRQCERLRDFPELQLRLRSHLQDTSQQLRRLERRLEACGESPSALKDAALSLIGNLTAFGNALAGDEILKNTFADNAFEHFEIAAYKSLLALAEAAGMPEAVADLTLSLQEEEQMAAWLDARVQDVTLAFLSRQQRSAA
jgi:ferritin-like metal-binding protein YciE